MHLTKLTTARSVGFKASPVYRTAEPRAVTSTYLKEKTSFFIATLSIVAFLGGNMVGQHGWYAFWKSVMGAADDSLVTYTGMVSPVEYVPDYTRWSAYGGTADANTFRQVPHDLLIPLPTYSASAIAKTHATRNGSEIYSVGYMGDYTSGNEGEGSHPGVDIRLPEGTPVRSVAAGIVTRVANDPSGFGLYVTIRNPHIPDPQNPGKTMVVFSNYAHLSAQYVVEGEVVDKGEQIGLSGRTGDASGPHLHFQIDKDTAPWHPYWPFSSADARSAGVSFYQAINDGLGQGNGYQNTINPIVFVQSNGTAGLTVAQNTRSSVASSSSASSVIPGLTFQQRAAQRLAQRAAALAVAKPSSSAPTIEKQTITAILDTPPTPLPVSSSSVSSVAAASSSSVMTTNAGSVSTIDIQHDGSFTGRAWETVRFTLQDIAGNTVQPDRLEHDLVLRTAFGEAEFNPPVLTISSFKNGVATVQMLPRGRRTVVIQVMPDGDISSPMKFQE